MGYHSRQITRGVYGERTKILEEFDEWVDSCDQQCVIMELVELSDLLGAIGAYTLKHYNINLNDLLKMSRITSRAFEDGTRTSRHNVNTV